MIDDRLENDDLYLMAMYLMDGGHDSHGLCPKGIVVVQQPWVVESWTHIVLERAVRAWIARSTLHGPPAAYIWDSQHGHKMINTSILELWMVWMSTLLESSSSTSQNNYTTTHSALKRFVSVQCPEPRFSTHTNLSRCNSICNFTGLPRSVCQIVVA